MVGSKRFIKCRSRVTTRTDRSQMSFSNKLFIFCSVWFVLLPAVASISQWVQGYRPIFLLCGAGAPPTKTARDIFTSELSELDCNVRSRIYEHVAGVRRFAFSQKKPIRNFVGFLQGLAIIVLYALSFVVSVVSLSVLLVNTVYSASRSSLKYQHTVSVASDMAEIKNNVVVLFAVSLLMFQSAVFCCFTGKCLPRAQLHFKKRIIKWLLGKTLVICMNKLGLYEIVHMLLILSGDIELNPGPTPPSEEPESRSTDLGYLSDISRSVSATPLPPLSNSETPLHNNSNSVLSDDVTLPSMSESDGIETAEGEQETENIPLVTEGSDYVPLLAQRSHDYENESEISQSFVPVPDVTPQQPNAQVTQGLPTDQEVISIHEHRQALEFKDSLIEDMQKKLLQQQQRIDELTQNRHVHQKHTWPEIEFQSSELSTFYRDLQLYVTTYLDLETFKCEKSNEEAYCYNLNSLLNKLITKLKKLNMWTEGGGFETGTESAQVLFYLIVNHLLRLGKSIVYCPLCCCHKDMRCVCNSNNCCACKEPNPCNCNEYKQCVRTQGYPQSHVWPSCMLKAYGEIHNPGSQRFIMNVTDSERPKPEAPGNMRLVMLCAKCEKDASNMEKELCYCYRYVSSCPRSSVEVNNENNWLQRIFATIMVRGLFMNVNLVKTLPNEGLLDTLFDLVHYCNKRKEFLRHRLYLFLLPNHSVKPKLKEFLYLYDLTFRSPKFTSFVKFEHGSYLYTQFDCFHCVYPVDQKCAKFLRSEYGVESGCFFNPANPKFVFDARRDLFPAFLIKQNIESSCKLMANIVMFYRSADSLSDCIAFIKVGQSVVARPLMLIFDKDSSDGLYKSTPSVVSYDRERAECNNDYHFFEECTLKAAKQSYIAKVPFGRISPEKAIRYINVQFNIRKVRKQFNNINKSVAKHKERIESLQTPLQDERQETMLGYQDEDVSRLKDEFHRDIVRPCEETEARITECEISLKIMLTEKNIHDMQ